MLQWDACTWGVYATLSSAALRDCVLLYKLRPKHHYFEHCLDECSLTAHNPLQQSCFVDEDAMKHLRGVAMSCHPSTVRVTWGRRFLLKQILLRRRLKLAVNRTERWTGILQRGNNFLCSFKGLETDFPRELVTFPTSKRCNESDLDNFQFKL